MNIKLFMCLVLLAISLTISAKEYVYIDYSVPDSFDKGMVHVFLDVESKKIMSSDWVEAITVCDDNNKYYCFGYSAVIFSVPKGGVGGGQEWVSENVPFKVLRREDFKLLGKMSKVWVIRARRSIRDDIFYYSETDGLLAFKHVGRGGRQVQFFIISGSKGFPQ